MIGDGYRLLGRGDKSRMKWAVMEIGRGGKEGVETLAGERREREREREDANEGKEPKKKTTPHGAVRGVTIWPAPNLHSLQTKRASRKSDCLRLELASSPKETPM